MSIDVQTLAALGIDSVECIELLLLLRRSPETYWRAHAAAQQLGIAEGVTELKLANLMGAGAIIRGEETLAYRYAPKTADIRARVDAIADAYANRRSEMINTIYSANLQKLRAFAEAFKLKDKS